MPHETLSVPAKAYADSLADVIPQHGYPIDKFLQIAINLTQQLIDFKKNNVQLSTITPYVVNCTNPYQFYDPITIINWLNDLKSDNSAQFNQQVVRYLAPEETGRIAYKTDQRSQLYSLGIIFFQLLSGQTPFNQDNLLHLVHAHLTEKPPSLTVIKPTIPAPLATMINKLINKRPSGRYQTAEGLLYDLEKLEGCLQSHHSLQFELRTHDHHEALVMSPNFVGRDRQLRKVIKWLKNNQHSTSKCMQIAGSPGIGKTTFIQEQYKVLAANNIISLYGKHSMINRSSAYSGLIAAISNYLSVFTHNKKMAMSLRNSILKYVGVNAYLLVDLCYPLKILLGKQPRPEIHNYADNKHRFHLTIGQFLKALTAEKQPIVFCLDDMQWADQPTINLLNYLINNRSLSYLKVILLYRDNEVVNDAFKQLLEQINNYPQTLTLKLQPLTLANTRKYLSYCLINSESLSNIFYEILHGRSQGNPLFLKLFLQNLYENNILKLTKNNKWKCDIEKLKALKSDLKISDVILQKLSSLPKTTQTILTHAACLGNTFIFTDVNRLLKLSDASILAHLNRVVAAGFVFQIGSEYHFVHDHIHEGCISLLSPSQKTKVYYKIATLLFKRNKFIRCIETDLTLIRQINAFCSNIDNSRFNLFLAELNLKACEEAESISAYRSCAEYANFAISILSKGHWHTHYNLTKELHKKAAVYQYVIGNNQQSDELFSALLSNLKSYQEKAETLSLEVVKYMKLSMLEEAIEKAIASLKLCKIYICVNPNNNMIQEEQNYIENALAQKPIPILLDTPKLTNRTINIAMSTLPNLAMCGYLSGNSSLFMFAVLKGVNLSILHGQCDLSAYMFAWYGLFLVNQQKYYQGYQFGKLALKITEKYQHCRERGQVYNIFGTCISHYYEPLSTSIDILNKGLKTLSTGDVVAACYCSTNIFVQAHARGTKLTELQQLIRSTIDLAQQYCVLSAGDISSIYQKFCASLQLGTDRYNLGTADIVPYFSTGENNKNKERLEGSTLPIEQLKRIAMSNSITFYHHCQLQQQFWFHNYLNAIQVAQFAQSSLVQTPGYIMNTDHHFIYAMSVALYYINLDYNAARIATSNHRTKRLNDLWHTAFIKLNISKGKLNGKCAYGEIKSLLKSFTLTQLEDAITLFTTLANNEPNNFKAKWLTMQLIRDWIVNHSLDQTIQKANEILLLLDQSENLAVKALLYEILCLILLVHKCPLIAVQYLKNAITAYNQWGALSIATLLNKRHAELLPINSQISQNDSIIQNEIIDYTAINTLSSVLSTSTKEKDIYTSILTSAAFLTGAGTAYLILKQDQDYLIRAVLKENCIHTYENQHILFDKLCPVNVIDAVTPVLQRQKVTLNHYDPIQPESTEYLSLPILLHGNCLGALYLHNELLDAVFNSKHITILSALLSQMALTLTSLRDLNLSEQRYQSLARLSPVGIFEADALGRCTYLNKNCEKIIGISARLALDQGWHSTLHPEDADKVIHAWTQAVKAKKPFQLEYRFLHQNGTVKWVYSQAVAQYDNNILKSWIGTITDMTKLHQAESQLQQQKMELVHYSRLNVGGELISGIAHDLNQPLASIKNYITGSIMRLKNVDTDPEILEALQSANHLATRAGHTINTFKDFLKKRPVNKSTVNIKSVIHEALRLVKFELSTAQISTNVICTNQSHLVKIDKIQIEQALINIIFNAIDALKNHATSNKFLTINIEQKDINTISISIEDNGTGIAKNQLAQIFEPFHTTKQSGMGMGLAICYSIIEMHNGHIWAESKLGQYTRIRLALPIE